jgi:hypothetical protein
MSPLYQQIKRLEAEKFAIAQKHQKSKNDLTTTKRNLYDLRLFLNRCQIEAIEPKQTINKDDALHLYNA